VVIDHRGHQSVHSAGTSLVGANSPIGPTDHIRLASVSKAFSGAVALSLVKDGVLSLHDQVARWLPSLPRPWSKVTLGQLLQHTSGIPDFSDNPAFIEALIKSPLQPPPHSELLSYAASELLFTPGHRYHYSNSDNIVVALMVEAATHVPYEVELSDRVLRPLGLADTSLPNGADMPTPFVHGYDVKPGPAVYDDVTGDLAAGWSWSSGGVVSTAADAGTFIRSYVRGATTDRKTHAAQFRFRPGGSEPPGPGVNSAGMAIFRYRTRCGTVYGHTGNTLGYTNFVAANRKGTDSVVVTINAQITPKVNGDRFGALLGVDLAAVCAALGRR
jgi:D-alanyl-D-alanine carboxypeptidase